MYFQIQSIWSNKIDKDGKLEDRGVTYVLVNYSGGHSANYFYIIPKAGQIIESREIQW